MTFVYWFARTANGTHDTESFFAPTSYSPGQRRTGRGPRRRPGARDDLTAPPVVVRRAHDDAHVGSGVRRGGPSETLGSGRRLGEAAGQRLGRGRYRTTLDGDRDAPDSGRGCLLAAAGRRKGSEKADRKAGARDASSVDHPRRDVPNAPRISCECDDS